MTHMAETVNMTVIAQLQILDIYNFLRKAYTFCKLGQQKTRPKGPRLVYASLKDGPTPPVGSTSPFFSYPGPD